MAGWSLWSSASADLPYSYPPSPRWTKFIQLEYPGFFWLLGIGTAASTLGTKRRNISAKADMFIVPTLCTSGTHWLGSFDQDRYPGFGSRQCDSLSFLGGFGASPIASQHICRYGRKHPYKYSAESCWSSQLVRLSGASRLGVGMVRPSEEQHKHGKNNTFCERKVPRAFQPVVGAGVRFSDLSFGLVPTFGPTLGFLI